MSITPEQSAAWNEAKGVDRENYDPGFCDGCDCPLTPDVECGLCSSCCGTDDGGEEWDGTFTPEQEALHIEVEANTEALLRALFARSTDDE